MPTARHRPDRRKQVIQVLLPSDGHFSNYSVHGLQRALIGAGLSSVALQKWRWVTYIAKLATKLGLVRNITQHPRYALLAQVPRLSELNLFPAAYFFESVVVAFDCWPYRYDEWERFFRRQRIRLAFLSARQSVEEFRRRIPEMTTLWLPEACDPGDYLPDHPLVERTTDVLEIGRRYGEYHALIREPLRTAGRKHLFERVKGALVFPTQADLARGYGDAKVSVCFPSAMTDPQWAGAVETTTLRYFESMASKCLVVGHAPVELIDLYGYNPVIEADLTDPAGQLQSILSDVEPYQALVDRNFVRTLQVGTLDGRAREIVQTLLTHGYRL